MFFLSPCKLAAILPADPARFAPAVARAAALRFTHVEAAALADRPAAHLEALADAGVLVACAVLSGAPGAGGVQARRDLLGQMQLQVADAARLGATCAVLTPCAVEESAELPAFSEFLTLLARYASRRMVRLALPPAAGTVLPDAPAALAWLAQTADDNLGLALGGESAALVRQAGAKLFHVQLGRAAPDPELGAALAEIHYNGAVAVDLETFPITIGKK